MFKIWINKAEKIITEIIEKNLSELKADMTQQSHCWAYTQKKQELKETCVPQCSLSTVYNSQDTEAT